VFDIVLLFVEFTFPEEVINGFVILYWVMRYCIEITGKHIRSQGIDLRGCISTPCFSVLR